MRFTEGLQLKPRVIGVASLSISSRFPSSGCSSAASDGRVARLPISPDRVGATCYPSPPCFHPGQGRCTGESISTVDLTCRMLTRHLRARNPASIGRKGRSPLSRGSFFIGVERKGTNQSTTWNGSASRRERTQTATRRKASLRIWQESKPLVRVPSLCLLRVW